MLNTLITNKTRLKLLLKFFLNSKTRSYLRNLETEFGESTNAIRLELNRFEKAGLLEASLSGNKKMFQANTRHPLFNDINSILQKMVGIDRIIEEVTSNIGDLQEAYLTGEFAKGNDSSVIDLVLVGTAFERMYITTLIEKTEKLINRKIKFITIDEKEKDEILNHSPALLIWKA